MAFRSIGPSLSNLVLAGIVCFSVASAYNSSTPCKDGQGTCLDLNIFYTHAISGKFLPTSRSGATCDPDAGSSKCYGGAARRTTYVNTQKKELNDKGEGAVFVDLGGFAFGGPFFGHPDYPLGTPSRIIRGLMPYDMCLFGYKDLLTSDNTEKGRTELAQSFKDSECPFLAANAKFNHWFTDFGKKVKKYMVKKVAANWTVGFVGYLPNDRNNRMKWPLSTIDVDPGSDLTALLAGNRTWQESQARIYVNVTELKEHIHQYPQWESMPHNSANVVRLLSLVPSDVLAAATECKKAHPEVKSLVLFIAQTFARQDTIEWLIDYGPFDVIVLGAQSGAFSEPKMYTSRISGKKVVFAGSDTPKGVGHVKVRIGPQGAETFTTTEDISLGIDVPDNVTVKNKVAEFYEYTKKINAQPFGKVLNPLIGGTRKRENPPSRAQCMYTDCSGGKQIGQALLWKAQKSGVKVHASFSNMGSYREALTGDADGNVGLGDCLSTLKFQNELAIYQIVGKDLLESLKLRVVSGGERGFLGAGIRIAMHEPCWEYVNHTNYIWDWSVTSPGSKEAIAKCTAAGIDPVVKLIDVEIEHVDYDNCADWTNCDKREWKTLEKGTTYTLVSQDYCATREMMGMIEQGFTMGPSAVALCEYIRENSPLKVQSWEKYRDQGNVQYATPQEGWATGNRIPSVRSPVSTIEAAATCPDGKYLLEGFLSCEECPVGRSSIMDISRNRCDLCKQGTYGDMKGLPHCKTCAPGKFQGDAGKSKCEPCPMGSYSDTAAMYCNSCPKGTYTNKTGSSECTACDIATYANTSSAAKCQDCPVGFTTRFLSSTSLDQCSCDAGTYRSGDECLKCPQGMKCKFGASMEKGAPVRPLLDAGFWSSQAEPLSVFRCGAKVNADRCPGGVPESCGMNLQGRACALCNDGWSWDGEKCIECSSTQTSVVIFPVVPLILGLIVIRGMEKFTGAGYDKWRHWRPGGASIFFVVLNHYQIVALLESTSIPYPPNLLATFNAFDFANNPSSVFSLACAGMQNFKASFAYKACIPAALGAIALMTYGLFTGLARASGKDKLAMDKDKTQNVFHSLIFTFYAGIAAMSFSLFKCPGNPNNKRTLYAQRSIICFEEEWNGILIIAVAAVVLWCFGFGAVFMRAIIISKSNFHDVRFQRRWQFLFQKYRADVHWWALVYIALSILLNLGSVIFEEGIWQLFWIIACLTLYLCLAVMFRPWRHMAVNVTDVWAKMSLILVCALNIWYARSDVEAEEASTLDIDLSKMTLGICIACVLPSAMLAMAYMLWTQVAAKALTSKADKIHNTVKVFKQFAEMEYEFCEDTLNSLEEIDFWFMMKAREVLMTEVLGIKCRPGYSGHTQLRVSQLRATRKSEALAAVNPSEVETPPELDAIETQGVAPEEGAADDVDSQTDKTDARQMDLNGVQWTEDVTHV